MSLGPQRGVALIVCWLLLFVYLYNNNNKGEGPVIRLLGSP